MTRDYWMYQERTVKDPFAVHVWVIDRHHVDFAFYAENIPAKTRKYLYVDIKLSAFMQVFYAFAKLAKMELTNEDFDQVTELFLSIKQDL